MTFPEWGWPGYPDGGGGCACGCFFRWKRKNIITPATRAMSASPPTTPPTIAPTGVVLPVSVGLGEGDGGDGDGEVLIPTGEELVCDEEMIGDEVFRVWLLAEPYTGDQLGKSVCPENVVSIGYNPPLDTESHE